MLVPVHSTRALLFEDIYFKRMASPPPPHSKGGCRLAAFGKDAACKILCWALPVCLLILYHELVACILKVGTSDKVLDFWLLLKTVKVGLLGRGRPASQQQVTSAGQEWPSLVLSQVSLGGCLQCCLAFLTPLPHLPGSRWHLGLRP